MAQVTDILTSSPVLPLIEAQLKRFTKEALRAKVVGKFDVKKAIQILDEKEGERVKAVDLGGDKVNAVTLQVVDGSLQPDQRGVETFQSNNGEGYLKFLEGVATEASSVKLPLGIASAGPLEGSKPLAWHKTPVFMEELQKSYGGDLAKLFPTLTVLYNDAVAGLINGAVEAQKRFPQSPEVLYLINGSGIGGAVLKDDTIYALEPGHVSLLEDLNPFHQNKACGVFGEKSVCIELVAGSKAGVEDLWQREKGEARSGEEISQELLAGDNLAVKLYSHSVYLLAHVIMGIKQSFGLFEDPNNTVLVCHGGAFKVPGYTQRLQQLLQVNLKFPPSLLVTYDFTFDACAGGAGLGALMGQS